MNNTIYRIRKYKEILADISDIDIRVQEIEEDILGISGQGIEERTGKTYKITSSVEQQAEKFMEKKEELYKEQSAKKRELKRIDNAMSVLTEEERDIIQIVHVEHRNYWVLEQKLNKTYRRIKQIEFDAITKMKRYIS